MNQYNRDRPELKLAIFYIFFIFV